MKVKLIQWWKLLMKFDCQMNQMRMTIAWSDISNVNITQQTSWFDVQQNKANNKFI